MTAEEKKAARENAMAGDKPLSQALLDYYQMSPAEKQRRYLDQPMHVELFKVLPPWVAEPLRDAFLNGMRLKDIPMATKVIDYFQANSTIIPSLTKDAGTFTMLEKMYHFEGVQFPVDVYFKKSIPGGQALNSRYHKVNDKAAKMITQILSQNGGKCLAIDIGSGPGRNSMDILKGNPEFQGKVQFDNIDTDPLAFAKHQELLASTDYQDLQGINFIHESMMQLNGRYPKSVDFGLLIGILCGLPYRERVGLLYKLRGFFKPGSSLIAAGLTNEMLAQDLFCSYILLETTGWVLQYPPMGEVEKAFLAAGWEWGGCFFEETGLYEIGIGIAP